MGLFGCEYLETRGGFFTTYICKRTMKEIESRTAEDVCMSGRYYDCYDYKNGSMCFITTAVCLTMGKPDDCDELTEMRRFRDEWLRFQPDGTELIENYYKTAPTIVEQINKEDNRKEIFASIYRDYILPCVEQAKKGCYSESKKIYVAMVDRLNAQYC